MDNEIPLGLTFDDVLLVPRRSDIRSRKDVTTKAQLTRSIELNVPIISANMDSVTESPMAIKMAQLGGIGIIHRFLPIKDQIREVKRVKRSESLVIEKPHTILPSGTVGDVRKIMKAHNIGGIPVIDEKEDLIGIITRRDILFTSDKKIQVAERMTPKKELITAPVGITMEEAQALLRDHRIEKLPLLDEEGNLAGLITSTDILKRRLYPNASKDEKGRLLVGAAIGVHKDDFKRAEGLLEAGCDLLVIDIAHGHSDLAIKTVEEVKNRWPEAEIMAGNVATPDGVKDLVEAGADAVKVGVGPGSICITRLVAGSGVPQFTAIQNCAEVARDAEVPIVSDGGIRGSGDIVKALGAGASSVMIGSLLAGTDESPGFTIVRNGRKYKVSRGMASLGAAMGREAREKKGKGSGGHFGEVVPEGVEAMVPYRGSVVEVLSQLIGGLRSGMSYSGAHSLDELHKVAKFIRQTGAGQKESGPHDVETIQ